MWVIILIIIAIALVVYIATQYISLAIFEKNMEKGSAEIEKKFIDAVVPKIIGKKRAEAEIIIREVFNREVLEVESADEFYFSENTCKIPEGKAWISIALVIQNGKVQGLKLCDDEKKMKKTWENGRLVLA